MTNGQCPDLTNGQCPDLTNGQCPDLTNGQCPDLTNGLSPVWRMFDMLENLKSTFWKLLNNLMINCHLSEYN